MSNLPHIVRQRLGVSSGADHPDADLLTAFAERQLAAPERERVLAHLGTCAACREIVALASVEETRAQTVITPVGNRSWWSVRSYQYGTLAAALVLAAIGLAVLRPDRARKSAEVAAVTSTASPSGSAVETERADKKAEGPAEQEQQAKTFGGESRTTAKRGVAAGAIVLRNPGAQPPKELDRLAEAKEAQTSRVSASNSETLSGAMTRGDQAAAPVTSSDLPAVSSKPAAAPAVPATVTNAAAVRAGNPVAGTAPVRAADGAQGTSTVSSKALADAATSAAVTQTAPVRPPAGSAIDPTPAAQAQRQTAGRLAIAKDEEAKQQAFKFDARYNARTAIWRIRNGRLQKLDAARDAYDDVTVSGTARLSVVGSLGTEVWAGGTDGTLHYSNDQGAHWIAVSTGAWSKDATFVGLTPTALRSVEVHLSNGERWRSADGGASWSKYQ